MRECRNTHLESNARKATEHFIHIEYLLCYGFGIADQQRTGGSAQSIKLCPRSWRPAAFLANLGKGMCISRIKVLCGLLRGVSQEADGVKAHDEFLCGVADTTPSLAIKVDKWPEALGFAANNGHH